MTAVADPLGGTRAPRPLNLATKLFYGVGSVAFGVKDNGFSYLLLLFYNQVVGMPVQLVGLALMIALLYDAVIDPLIGQMSDNLRSPWGRRHPFMYAAALPLALGYMALWNPPHWGHQALFWYLLLSAMIIRTFSSFFEVPSSALAAEFSTGYDERSSLLSYRFFFGWIGGLSIQLIAFAVLLRPDATHKVGQLNPVGYVHYGMVASAVMFCAILISAAGTHSRIPTLMPPPPKRRLSPMQVLREGAQTLNNRSFLFLLTSTFASAMAIGLGASLNGYFNTFFWGFTAQQISVLTGSVFLAAFAALFAGPRISRRLGKRRTTVTFFIAAVVVGLAPLLLRTAGLMPPNHSPLLFGILICTSIVNVTFGIIATTMGSSMIADVVEEAELKTGRRSEGLFFAAAAFVAKAVSACGVAGAAILIGAIHLNPRSDPSTVAPDVLQNLALIYCPVVIGLYSISLLLLSGYRINRASHDETLRQLARNNTAAE